MPPPKASRTNPPNDRPATRAELRDSSSPECQHDTNNATEGRNFLEKHLLLCPAGEPVTHGSLATCLHQVSSMAGVTRPVVNAIRAVAFLLGEMEEIQINDTIRAAFDVQIMELTADMATLIDEAKGKLNEHFKETEGRLTQIIDKAIVQPQQTQQGTYASISNSPPPHANPRVSAKEGIKARQFLMEGLKDTKFSHMDIFQLKMELNIILGGLGLKNRKIKSINKIHNDGTLIGMDSDEATNWLSGQENQNKFCTKLGPEVSFRTRAYSLIAYNVPLGLSPEVDGHRQEICEANSLDPNTITTM
jgi:hypothetical protein